MSTPSKEKQPTLTVAIDPEHFGYVRKMWNRQQNPAQPMGEGPEKLQAAVQHAIKQYCLKVLQPEIRLAKAIGQEPKAPSPRELAEDLRRFRRVSRLP